MNCDINLFSCLQKEKQDIIKLAIKCKVICNEKDEKDEKEICKLIIKKYQTDLQYKNLCLIQDV